MIVKGEADRVVPKIAHVGETCRQPEGRRDEEYDKNIPAIKNCDHPLQG